MIDSHCHLADKAFHADLDRVLKRAQEAGVETMVSIADTLDEAEACIVLAEKYPQIFATVGMHPHVAKDWQEGDLERMKQLIASSENVKAVGEIGLDYHYDNSPRDVQKTVFRRQLELAKELDLPTVIHNRESIADLRPIVEEVDSPRFVIHCCTEKWEDVSWVVDRGSLLSFTGIATYPKSEEIRRTITKCPLSQMMIETDAPYLSPVPHRGKPNEPAFVVEVAKLIADLKGVSLEEVEERTTENTKVFYGI